MAEKTISVKKQLISILFLILLIFITYFCYLRGYSYHELLSICKNANTLYLFLGLTMMLIFVLCEALNIYLIMNVLGQKVPFCRCIQYSSIGFYFSALTPSSSGGQPAQIYYMKKDQIPFTVSSITIFFIVYIYQIAMMSLGAIFIMIRFSEAVLTMNSLHYLFLFGLIVNTGVIFLLFSLMFSQKLLPSLYYLLIKIGINIRLIKKGSSLIEKFEVNASSYHEKAKLLLKHPILFFQVFFVTMIQMLSYNLIPSFIFLSMGNNKTSIINLITCQSILTISVSAVPLPGAEGVVQGGFLQVFHRFFSENSITSAMFIHRIISFYLPLLFCCIISIYTHIRTQRKPR